MGAPNPGAVGSGSPRSRRTQTGGFLEAPGLGIGTSRIEAGGLRDVGAYKGAPPTDGPPLYKSFYPRGLGVGAPQIPGYTREWGVKICKTRRASKCQVKHVEDVVPPLRKYPVPSVTRANEIPSRRRAKLAPEIPIRHHIER